MAGFPGLASYACSGQGTSNGLMLGQIRALVRGDRMATIAAVRERYVSSHLSTNYDESSRNFPVLNELGAIIARRIDCMPNTFEVECDTEATETAASEWASGPVSDRGRSLYSLVHSIVRDQERDGNAVLVLYMDGDMVRVMLRDSLHMTVELDPVSGDVRAYEFRYGTTAPGGDSVEHIERIDAASITRDGVPVPHSFGEIPVVVIPRDDDHGSPVGTSGVLELLEAYLHYLWSSYLLNVANKYESHGVYCPAPGDMGAMLPDADNGKATQWRISPGSLYPIPIVKVGGSINVGSIMEQVSEAKSTLYRLGRVRQETSGADMRSGKAMLIDTAEMRDYAARKLGLLRDGLNTVFRLWASASGVNDPSLSVVFPSLDDDDMGEQTKRAELALKGQDLFGPEIVARVWQDAGLIDEDTNISDLVSSIEERKAQAAEDAMNAVARRAQAASPDGNTSTNGDRSVSEDG